MSKLPRKVIKDKAIIENTWFTIENDNNQEVVIPSEGDIIVSLAFWLENKESLSDRNSGKLGLSLESTDEPDLYKDDLLKFDMLTINFPAFADGRGYSLARLMRERYGYKGEVRAVGDVLRDQLFYMQRCGFNAFEIREDRCIEDALNAYNDFSITYQAAVDNPNPIYRQKLA